MRERDREISSNNGEIGAVSSGMSSAYTPILVGVVSSVLEIWLPFKNGQISLSGHGL